MHISLKCNFKTIFSPLQESISTCFLGKWPRECVRCLLECVFDWLVDWYTMGCLIDCLMNGWFTIMNSAGLIGSLVGCWADTLLASCWLVELEKEERKPGN